MISCESLITPKKDVPESSLFPPLHVHETEFKRCQDIFIKSHWQLSWQRIHLQCRRPWFDPWVRKIPRRMAWQFPSVLLPGESPWTRNMQGYSPWGHKESDTTERLSIHQHSMHVYPESLQSCQSLLNPMDCSPPGFPVRGILQATTLEQIAVPSSRGYSQPRD